MCPLFQTEVGRTSGLSLFRLLRLNRIAVLDLLSLLETKCWLSYSKQVLIKGLSFPIHDHLKMDDFVGNQGGRKAKEALNGWLVRGFCTLLGSLRGG